MFHFTHNLIMSHNILLEILPYEKIRQATGLLKNFFPPYVTLNYCFSPDYTHLVSILKGVGIPILSHKL